MALPGPGHQITDVLDTVAAITGANDSRLHEVHYALRALPRAHEDRAEASMPEDDKPVRITEICLCPRITVRGDVAGARVRRLVELAHRECYIANSLSSSIIIEPTIELAPEADSTPETAMGVSPAHPEQADTRHLPGRLHPVSG